MVAAVSALQIQNEEQMFKLTTELSGAFTNSVKAITSFLQPYNNESVPSMLKQKVLHFYELIRLFVLSFHRNNHTFTVVCFLCSYLANLYERYCDPIQSQNMEPATNRANLPQRVYTRRNKRKPERKAETRLSSKQKPDSLANAHRSKMNIPEEIPLIDLDEEWRENNELDEELDGGFAYLLGEEETGVGSSFFDEDQVEAEQILRKARRRNRKHSNIIVLD